MLHHFVLAHHRLTNLPHHLRICIAASHTCLTASLDATLPHTLKLLHWPLLPAVLPTLWLPCGTNTTVGQNVQ